MDLTRTDLAQTPPSSSYSYPCGPLNGQETSSVLLQQEKPVLSAAAVSQIPFLLWL